MKKSNSDDNIKRINLILRTIRNVNQLIIREKDRTQLIKGICDNLTENRGYYNAWIMLWDETGNLIAAAEANIGGDFLLINEKMKKKEMIDCVKKALKQSGIVITKDPFSACKSCPQANKYAGRGAITIRLEYEEKIFGVLCLSIPKGLILDEEEHGLLEEVAGDVSFGLHTIELAEEQKYVESQMEKNLHKLNERVKELNCLFAISEIVDQKDIVFEEIAQKIVDVLPSAWQYPEITCARVIFGNQEFRTRNFNKTKWNLTSKISTYGKPIGGLEVSYLEKKPESDEGPFLREERALIDSIAERLGKIFIRLQAEKSLIDSEKRFRRLVENLLTGISIIRNNQVIFQNLEQEKFLGPLPRSAIFLDMDNIHSDDVEKVKEFYKKVKSGKRQPLDIDFRFYPPVKNDIGSGMKWVYCRTSLIRFKGKDSILVNMVDITKLKELEQLLRIQDKMTSLGRVAAGIAHEIRNPLSGINIYLNTLEKIYDKIENIEKVEKIIGQIKSASRKIESVIRRVMDFSKPGEPKFILTDLNKPITAAIDLSSVTLRKCGIKIEKELAEDLPACYLDPSLIEEVILNLINNATDAMINTDNKKIVKVTSYFKNDNLYVCISDSGPGISPNIKDKMFDPFYTTKNGSTGIGLNLCHRIISDHGGTLDVTTSILGGAEFIIEIPVKEGAYRK